MSNTRRDDLIKASIPTAPTELKVGDQIIHYGVVFQLTERKEFENRENPEHGVTVVFYTKLIEDMSNGGFPKNWLNDWKVQGNKFAYFNKI